MHRHPQQHTIGHEANESHLRPYVARQALTGNGIIEIDVRCMME